MDKINDSDYIRDPENNGIINTNKSEQDQYISRRNAKKDEDKKFKIMEDDLSRLKNDIDEIKSLLTAILNK